VHSRGSGMCGMAAKPKVVRRLISFPTKHRAKRTCEPCGRGSCEIYRCHCQGFGTNRNQDGKGGRFLDRALLLLLSPRFPF
jgi:hypothetical protein